MHLLFANNILYIKRDYLNGSDHMEKFELKKKKKKIYQISLISLVALLALIIWIVNYIHMGFSIGDQKFRYVGEWVDEGKDYVFKDKEDNLVIIDVEELGARYFSFADKYKVSYLDKVIYSDSYDLIEEGWRLTLSDGKVYEKDYVSCAMNGWKEKSDNFDLQLVHGIERVIDFRATSRESFVFLLMGTFLIAIGLTGIIYPVELWKFQHMFSVAEGTPTELAVFSNRLTGVIVILIALLIYPLAIR